MSEGVKLFLHLFMKLYLDIIERVLLKDVNIRANNNRIILFYIQVILLIGARLNWVLHYGQAPRYHAGEPSTQSASKHDKNGIVITAMPMSMYFGTNSNCYCTNGALPR